MESIKISIGSNKDELSTSVSTMISDPNIEESDSKTPFIYEIYCEYILSNGVEYTNYNKINIYSPKSVEENSQVVKDLIAGLPQITSDTSEDEISSSLDILQKIVKTASINSSKVIYTNEGDEFTSENEIIIPKCTQNFCNKRGVCLAILNSLYCKCDEKFIGDNCEYSTETAKIIKDTSINLFKNLLKNFDDNNKKGLINVSSEYLIKLEKNSAILFGVTDKIEDSKIFEDLLDKILDTNDNKDESIYQNIKNNSKKIINSLNVLFSFTINHAAKIKIKNKEESQRIYYENMKKEKYSINQNIKIDEQSNKYFYNTSHDDVEIMIISNKNKRNKNTIPRFIQTKSANTNNQTNSTEKIIIEDYLNELQKLEYIKRNINQQNLLVSLGKNIIRGHLSETKNPFNMNISLTLNYSEYNTNFDFIIKQIPDINSYKSRTENLFSDRKNLKLSFIDAHECLSKFIRLQKFRDEIFLILINFKKPIYMIDSKMSSSALSLSNFFNFYNSTGDLIDISICNKEIKHYIPIQTMNIDFLQKYRLNPDKYQLNYYNLNDKLDIKNINSAWKKTFDKFKIFIDGTIDRNSSITYQIDKYYIQYKLNLIYYNTSLINSSQIFKDLEENFVESTNKDNYFIANSRKTGEFSIVGKYDPPTEYSGNNFYLYRNEIFNQANLSKNILFIILVSLISLNYFFVLCMFLYYLFTSNGNDYLNEEAYFELEVKTCNYDNDIFNCNDRYFIWN